MNKNGFSLIELLVAMTIMLFLLMMTTYTFQRIVHRSKDSSAGISTRGDNVNSIELMRLDLEHAGYGIADYQVDGTDNDIQPISWDSTNNHLNIASTMNNTNSATIGYAVAEYNGSFNTLIDKFETSTLSTLWLDTDNRIVDDSSSSVNKPILDYLYIGYHYNYSPTGATQPYSPIRYRLSTTQPLNDCDSNTRNLIRAVDGAIATGGSPVFNCVAGFTTEFAWDNNEDGDIADTVGGIKENHYTKALPSGDGSTIEIKSKLKYSMVYILSQVGKLDQTYTFSGYKSTSGKNITFTVDDADITFTTEFNFNDPDELALFRNYHWKVIKVSASLQSDALQSVIFKGI